MISECRDSPWTWKKIRQHHQKLGAKRRGQFVLAVGLLLKNSKLIPRQCFSQIPLTIIWKAENQMMDTHLQVFGQEDTRVP